MRLAPSFMRVRRGWSVKVVSSKNTVGVPTTTTRELHYHGTLRPTLCGLNMSCRALVRTVSSSRPSEAISMDQPGEGKQLLPQRQYNCFCTQPPSPQPVVVGPYMSIFELFYYLIDVLLLDV